MTQPHGGQFGRHLRSGRDDQPLEGHQERRRRPGDGCEPGREPSLRLQVGARGAGRERGATLVTVDPASRARRRSPIATCRSGPGPTSPCSAGWINYILSNGSLSRRVRAGHTNASFIVTDDFGFDDGLFSGLRRGGESSYDKSSWSYERGADGYVRRDPTLEHPRCVFQLLEQHYERYTPEVVAQIAGCSEEEFLEMAEILCSTGTRSASARSCTRSAGRCTRSAARSSAPPPSCSSCSATSAAGRRHQRAARPRQRAGRHRPRHRGGHPAGLSEGAPPRSRLARRPSRRVDAPAAGAGHGELLGQLPEVHGLPAQGWFGEHAPPTNEFGYHYLGKQDGRRHLAVDLGSGAPGRLEGFIALGFNPLLAGPDVPVSLRAMSKLKVEGRHRPVHARLGRVLEGAGR